MKVARIALPGLLVVVSLLQARVSRAECPDYVLMAPGNYAAATCGAGNDCGLSPSEDFEVQVEIPEDGLWTFSLCGSAFNTLMYIGNDCCLSDVCMNDNGCGDQASECYCLELLAGPYMVTIESGSAGECGEFLLRVYSCQAGDHGETCEDAIIIPSLPYSMDGNTCNFVGDYDFGCTPQTPSTPDVCYSFPAGYQYVDIQLCTDHWAGKLYVVDRFWNVVASNCGNQPCPSGGSGPRLLAVQLPGAACIVVDGMYGACGAYTLHVNPHPCNVTCPPESAPEGEPVCFAGYSDTYNGGCFWGSYTWSAISCGTQICGNLGNYWSNGQQRNDTDWYEFHLLERDTVLWKLYAQFPAVARLYTPGSLGCTNAILHAQDWRVLPCDTALVSAVLDSGTHWAAVFPAVDSGIACGTPYLAWLSCIPAHCPPVTHLTVVISVGGTCDLNWNSPGSGIDRVWSTIDPNHSGLDSTWTLAATVVSSAGLQSWSAGVPIGGYVNYLVTHVCP